MPEAFNPLGPKGTSYTFPLSAIKTSPAPSTATPVGAANVTDPVPMGAAVLEPAAYSTTSFRPGSAT